MPLSTHDQLLAALAVFSGRSDQAAFWPDAITLAEAQLERDLRVRPMLIRADASLDGEYADLPGDCIEPLSLVLIAPWRRLRYLAPETVTAMKERPAGEGDGPRYYSVVGPQLQLFPAPAAAVAAELTYYQRLPPLSANSQNWLLLRHPDAYLHGALVQFGLMAEDERLAGWAQAYQTAIAGVRAAYPAPANQQTLRVDSALTHSI